MSHQLTLWDTPNATSSPVKASGHTRSGWQDGPMIARFGRDHAPVNLSARQAKERGLLTSGTFGRHSSTSCESSDLAFAIWSKLRPVMERDGSTLYRMTFKERALPSGRLIPQAQASAPRTFDPDSMRLSSWPTPSASDENDARGGYYGGRIREREGRPPMPRRSMASR